MRLPSAPTTAVVDHLNAIYFQQVWNAPREYGRANVQLHKVAERIKTGVVPIGQSVVGLPTTDAVYAVYKTGYRIFNQFIELPEDQWIQASTTLLSKDTYAAVYGVSGRTVPSSKIFLRYIPSRRIVLVAVSVKYTKVCVGESYPDLFLTVYKDITRTTPIVESIYVVGTILNGSTTPAAIMNAVAAAKQACPLGTNVMVNGWVYDPDHVPALVNNDIVQIISDPDVVGVVDVTIDDNATGYYSTLYGEYREILHIPKAINPNNVILTTDALTAVVYDTQTHKGVLGHRVNAHAIESVSHNDFSMGRTALSGFSQSLDAANINVRLHVRIPPHGNILNEDVNHIKDLYALNDSRILTQLLGLDSPQIPEWSAAHLEASDFLKLIYTSEREKLETAIPHFVSAMGYYDVASVLGQQMRYYTYKGAEVKIVKPVRLFGYPCQAIVYIDGEKVPETMYKVTDNGSTTFLLGFTLDSDVAIGDRIAVYICEQGYRTAARFSPTAEIPSITFDSADYTVSEQITYSSPQPVWKKSVTKGYNRSPGGTADYVVTTNSDGSSTFTFRMQHFGKTFYFIPKYGMTTASYNISSQIDNGNPIQLDLTTLDSLGDVIPLMYYETAEVYLNRKRLIEGLDYTLTYVKHSDGSILQNLFILSNNDYLYIAGEDNLIEIAIHGDKVVSEDKGYVIEQHLHREELPMIYSKSSSRVFVRGVLQENITESGNVATVIDPVDNGAPFLMQHMLSFGAAKLMASISAADENNFRSRIEHVLGLIPPDFPDLVVLDHLHALFSPFLAQVVTDVSRGELTLANDPQDINFVKQLKQYKLLADGDPVIGRSNPLIDRRFVTLAAHYVNQPTDDPLQMYLVQRLTTLLLTPSELSILEVLL